MAEINKLDSYFTNVDSNNRSNSFNIDKCTNGSIASVNSF
jgi:hypothetical protein